MSEFTGTTSTGFEKLGENNYKAWKYNMRMLLMDRGLWMFVEGNPVPPAVSASAKEKEDFELRKSRALSTIALGIKESEQHHIFDCVSAKEAWDILKGVYESSSRSRIMFLKREFVNIRFQESESMSTYLGRLKTCARLLNEAGKGVDDVDLAYSMIAGLPESYDNVIVQFNTVEDKNFTSNTVTASLLAEYERRINRYTEQEEIKAFTVAKQKGERWSGNHSQGAEEKQTHTYPWKPKGEGSKGTADKDNGKIVTFSGKCFKCGKYGHTAKYCPMKQLKSSMVGQGKTQKKYGGKDNSNDVFLAALCAEGVDDSWILDSGATNHFCNNRNWFCDLRSTNITEVLMGQGSSQVQGIGNIQIVTRIQGEDHNICLKNVLYTPHMSRNLISARAMDKHGYEGVISNNSFRIYNPNGNLIGVAQARNDLYVLNARTLSAVSEGETNQVLYNAISLRDIELWHKRFCHVGYKDLEKLSKTGMVAGLDELTKFEGLCHDCKVGKSTKEPHVSIVGSPSTEVLELVHSDLWGPAPVKSTGDSLYFITFIDDYSRMVYIYFLKNKSDVVQTFKTYHAMVERQTGKKLKRFRTDNGLEYCNNEMKTFCEGLGIHHEVTNVYSPQMNGVAERVNRTIVDLVNTSLIASTLPQHLWAETAHTVAYIKNRSPHSALNDMVPLERWCGRKPSVRHLKTFGCLAFSHIPKQKRTKFGPRAEKCILVGYAVYTKGYRLWRPGTKSVFETKHARFDESVGIEAFKSEYVDRNSFVHNQAWEPCNDVTSENGEKEKSDKEEKERNPQTSERPSNDACESDPTKRPREKPKTLVRNTYWLRGKPNPTPEANLAEVIIPETYEEALCSEQAEEWREAIRQELETHKSRGTWEPAELPPEKKAIGCRWVFTLKKNPDGEILRYKARLVAQGYAQKEGVDYKETYSPVINFTIIRLLICMVVCMGWVTMHLDVDCAYLYSSIQEIIYMKPPPGWEYDNQGIGAVLLKRAIYGLKQSGRQWFYELDRIFKQLGFKAMESCNCVYVYKNIAIIVVYVDDLAIFAKSREILEEVKLLIAKQFEIKDLGELTYLLGVQFERHEDGSISLSQEAYINKILNRFGFSECRNSSTPMDPGIKLTAQDSSEIVECEREKSPKPFREAIGSLMYLATRTRPDILFSLVKLSQFQENPNDVHWACVKHIFRYLSSTRSSKLWYVKSEKGLVAYSDADWASDLDGRQSFSGMVVTFGSSPIAWSSSKQRCVALSTMESEYVALSDTVRELTWLTRILGELPFSTEVNSPLTVMCDNRSAIDFSKNRVENNRSKHIDTRYHFVRNKVEDGLVTVKYVPSADNLADILTKVNKHAIHSRLCNMINLY